MSKRVAVVQSNYLPWKGYFDIIGSVDLFVFYDDRQYTKNSWRNRNRIKTAQGLTWLTVPCGSGQDRLICEVELTDPSWQRRHWKTLSQEYGRAEHFERYRPFFEDVYLGVQWTNLSELNQHLITRIATELLELPTSFDDSRAYPLEGRKGERLLELLGRVGASEYLSGPAARDYLDPADFERAGITLTWMDYSGYREHRQFHPPFVHEVSVVDLLFHEGPAAHTFLHCVARSEQAAD